MVKIEEKLRDFLEKEWKEVWLVSSHLFLQI